MHPSRGGPFYLVLYASGAGTPVLLSGALFGGRRMPINVQTARKPISEAHNRQETPLFAKSIERHALRPSKEGK